MISWPKGIYLEASVLYDLPIHVMNAEMERLKELSAFLKAPVFIPAVSFQEWIAKRKEAIKKYIENVENGLVNLSRIFDYVTPMEWRKNKESIINDTEAFTNRVLDYNRISVIPTPQIDLNELVSMSVNKIVPFEPRNEKGFRDSINLFTVLEHAKKQEKGSHCFIAGDKIYTHDDIQKRAKQYNIELVVISSIIEAISILEGYIKDVKKTFDEYIKLELQNFLFKNADKISEYIKQNAEFPMSFFSYGFSSEMESIEEIKVIGIDSITRGVLPKGTSQGKVKISFTAKTEFNVKIRKTQYPPEPKIKYGKETPSILANFLALAQWPYVKTLSNELVKVDVPLEGSVILTRGKNQEGVLQDKYSDLVIDNIILDKINFA